MGISNEAAGLMKMPLRTVFSSVIVPAKNGVHNAEMTMPEINRTDPAIRTTK
jgi:hypothetical protein